MSVSQAPFAAYCIEDFRQLARQTLPRMVFDFFDGAAGSEVTLRSNREALDRIKLVGSAPVDVGQRSLAIELFGRRRAMPIIIGPTGLAGAGWPKADIALAQAASDRGIPFVMSTAATSTMEEVAGVSSGSHWFQLYLFRDRAMSERMVARADEMGFEAIEVTVDCALAGRRLRDSRNGFSLPMRWGAAQLAQLAVRPRWAWRMARAGAPRLAVMAQELGLAHTETIAEIMQQQLDPTVSWADVQWLRKRWRHPLIVKGLMNPAQARMALEVGADAIVVSNHGGRQLDGSISSIDILPEFVAEVGKRLPILVDSGFRSGSDIAKALALGATAVQIGRATLYAASVGGVTAVTQALDILRSELDVAMGLMGLTSVDEFDSSMVRNAAVASSATGTAVNSDEEVRTLGGNGANGAARGRVNYAGAK